MRIYNIFVKNLKVVARNWIYFVFLFVFPFFLILTSAILLNASDFRNIKIGMVNDYADFSIDANSLGSVIYYGSISECLYYLSNYKVSVCIHVKEENGRAVINAHVDNTRRIIEMYARQTILEKVFREQTKYLETTSDFIDSRLTLYSTSLDEAYIEINDVEMELTQEEILLKEYRQNLANMRVDFDNSYYRIKGMQPQINNMRSNLIYGDANLENQIINAKNELANIETNLQNVKTFIGSRLTPSDYNYPASLLDSSITSIQNIEYTLNLISNNYNNGDLIALLDSYDDLIIKLDNLKIQLDKVETDLDDATLRMTNAKNRVGSFKDKIRNMKTEVINFQTGGNSGAVNLNFINGFEISGELVLMAFPFVVSIIITFSSLVLSNRFILNQVNKPSYQREIMAPTKDITYVLSDYIINLFFAGIQVFVLMIIGFWWFGIGIDKLSPFLISIFLVSSSYIFIGISIGYLIKSESLSTLFTIFIVMFLLIFSDMLVYSALLPMYLRFLINLSPFVILNNILNDTIIVGKNMSQLTLPLFRLGILLFSSFLIAYLSKKLSRENVIQ